jgi:hypothetical protein
MNHSIIYLKEKKENYLLRLEKSLARLFVNSFLNIYEYIKKNNKDKKYLLRDFQNAVKKISTWDTEVIKSEYLNYCKACINEKLDHLITNIFKLNYTLFCEIEDVYYKEHYEFPTPESYIYQCNLSIARKIWKEPYLVYDIGIDKIQYQKNILKIDKIARVCIHETFHQMISYNDLTEEKVTVEEDIKKHIKEDYNDNEDSNNLDEEEEEEEFEDEDEDLIIDEDSNNLDEEEEEDNFEDEDSNNLDDDKDEEVINDDEEVISDDDVVSDDEVVSDEDENIKVISLDKKNSEEESEILEKENIKIIEIENSKFKETKKLIKHNLANKKEHSSFF